ncbi:unnamed protein product [Umbelopsis ramanniana]
MPSRNRDDLTATIDIDPSFTGIIYGYADDEAEGCVVKGVCTLHIVKPCKIRRLFVSLDGKLKVNIKAPVSIAPASEGVETRTLISKHKHYHGEDGQMEILQPGDHVYPFEFELPSTLPATFHSKHGHISYRIRLCIHRPMFSNDITAKKEIVLRRCLMDEWSSGTSSNEQVEGVFEQLMHYNASAPGMTYREGGLVKLNLNFDLLNPYTSSIREITCALQETIQYRTTGVQAVNAHSSSKLDVQFPLGRSTFYPSKAPDYDSSETHDYNAVFRVWPRVHADTNTKLLKVSHKLVINVSVEDRSNKVTYSEAKARSKSAPTTPACSDNEEDDEEDPVRSSSSSIRSNSSSTSSSSIALPMSLPRPKPFRSRSSMQFNTYPVRTCKLEIPLVVTSREHVWEGEMPTPPAYETQEGPPSYFNTVVALPPVPDYDSQATESLATTEPQAATASAY